MAASRRNRRSRPAPPMATGPERLECRAMLTASAADAVIEVTATAADPAPWLTYAQQSPLGSLVLRVVLSPGNSPTAEPATTMQVLQATFNTSKSAGGQPPIQIGGVTNTIPGSSGPDQPIADPQFTGVVFPGQGVPVLPTDTWPKPIDALEGTPPRRTHPIQPPSAACSGPSAVRAAHRPEATPPPAWRPSSPLRPSRVSPCRLPGRT